MAWGARRDRRPGRDRLHRPGPLAHAGVVLRDRRWPSCPLVIFNMSRSQGDYFQATRGGGHGDYRHIVLAPQDVARGASQLVQLAFHLADKWRNPVLIYGDYLLAHTQEAVSVERVDFAAAAAEGLGRRRVRGGHRRLAHGHVARRRQARRTSAFGQEGKAQYIATKMPTSSARSARRVRRLRRRRDGRSSRSARRRKFVKYADPAAARRGR